MKSLSIIGAGKVGQTLARQWHEHGVFSIRSVVNRTPESARKAVSFIGAGTPAVEPEPADIYMIGAPDAAIEDSARKLRVEKDAVVFHCSGAYSSDLLKATGARTASLHPIQSFPAPLRDITGTYCALEGHPEAVAVLKAALEAIAAKPVVISGENKIIYHAASVFASNYLTALVGAALDCLEKAGIDRATGLEVLMPIIRGTVDNIGRQGPAPALTGPVARGDAALVQKQHEALAGWNPAIATLYKELGEATVKIAEEQGNVAPETLEKIRKTLGA